MDVDPPAGVRVNRNSLAESCQNVLLEVNISDHPSGVFSSVLMPTLELAEVIKPILSSFCIKFRPRNTPSRLMFMRHSPLGLPSGGVSFEAWVVRDREGSCW